MRIIAVFITALLLVSLEVQAGLSAHRLPRENFQTAKARSRHLTLFNQNQDVDLRPGQTPENMARPLNQIKIADIPEVQSYDQLTNEFKYIRDTSFLSTDYFARRLTWLYPDDGCFARAELAAEHLMNEKKITPKKVFAFGNLHAATDNSPAGYVEWWYHVAITFRVGNTAYVLDPALDAKEPMTLDEWADAIGENQTRVTFSICSKDAFDPDSICIKPPKIDEQMAEDEQRNYLPEEWNRLLELGRDPERELGNQPPWL
ncbi:protein-glutamine glutaminase family protein [Bdellovibrio sp. HCB209]|uniref:protein-glutamine glutaminase family protein n=1 Tax=Bdellovibrio sp. HCB209 TaxID=3394354 RepID=UPI0039B4381C